MVIKDHAPWRAPLFSDLFLLIFPQISAMSQTHPASTQMKSGETSGEAEGMMHHVLKELNPREVEKHYRLRLVSDPEPPVAGEEAKLTLYIADAFGKPVTTLQKYHERFVLFLLVSRNLEEFHHLHSEDAGFLTDQALRECRFAMPVTFESGRDYRLVIDFADPGYAISQSFLIKVKGPRQKRTRWNFSTKRTSGDLEIKLKVSGRPLKEYTPLDFAIELSSDGKDVTDLEPYLGAIDHLAIVREGASEAIHTHEESLPPWLPSESAQMTMTKTMGPRILFRHVFPTDSRYRIFTQFRWRGEIYTIPFDILVEEIVEIDS